MKLSLGCPELPRERDTLVDVWLDSGELQDDESKVEMDDNGLAKPGCDPDCG
jgi:hypothetical protein